MESPGVRYSPESWCLVDQYDRAPILEKDYLCFEFMADPNSVLLYANTALLEDLKDQKTRMPK